MNTSVKTLLIAAAGAGLFGGSASLQAATLPTRSTVGSTNPSDLGQAATGFFAQAADPGKHACKGMNSCKGLGGCSTGDNGCKAKNSCKGKGGCATDGSVPPSTN
jgi:hypothetical protein